MCVISGYGVPCPFFILKGNFMYSIEANAAFDSAHFLYGYDGKCRNIHGHRWQVFAEIFSEKLIAEGQCRAMVADFGDLKRDLRAAADYLDHSLIYEKGSLKISTLTALNEENFRLIEVPFRPTAENFAEYFYELLSEKGYNVLRVRVYETPDNCACYSKEGYRNV